MRLKEEKYKDASDESMLTKGKEDEGLDDWFGCCQYISWVPPKIIHLYGLKTYLQDESIPQTDI